MRVFEVTGTIETTTTPVMVATQGMATARTAIERVISGKATLTVQRVLVMSMPVKLVKRVMQAILRLNLKAPRDLDAGKVLTVKICLADIVVNMRTLTMMIGAERKNRRRRSWSHASTVAAQ